MQTNVIRDWPELWELSAEWNELLRDSRADNIFLTWEWIRTWYEIIGHNYAPFVITLRDDRARLCAIAPLYVQTHALCGLLRCRALRVMADFPTSAEYPDWIVRHDCEDRAVHDIYKVLEGHHREWDYLWLPSVSGWTLACERIAGKSKQLGFYCNSRPVEFSSFDLPATVEAHWSGLTSKRRKELRHQCRLVFARPDISITRCTSLSELPDYLEALFRLHRKRRQTLGDEGSFVRRPAQAQFYLRFAPIALEAGWLRFYALREGKAFRAAQLGYVYNGVFLGIQDGVDPGFVAGAGNVLRLEVVKACIAEGVKSYDFLGGYSEHKRRWGAKPRQGHDLIIGRPGVMNALLFAAKIWPTGRYLRPVHAPYALDGFKRLPSPDSSAA